MFASLPPIQPTKVCLRKRAGGMENKNVDTEPTHSPLWTHFDKCKHSGRTVSVAKGNTKNFFNHLGHNHFTEYRECMAQKERPINAKVLLQSSYNTCIYKWVTKKTYVYWEKNISEVQRCKFLPALQSIVSKNIIQMPYFTLLFTLSHIVSLLARIQICLSMCYSALYVSPESFSNSERFGNAS